MAKGVRVPERAFGIAMWVVSVVLAAFIVGLGNLVIGDLPQVEQAISQDQFVQSAPAQKIRTELAAITARRGAIDDKLEIARLQLEQAQKASTTGTETFQAWIQARTATTTPQQDPEVLARTRELEQLKAKQIADAKKLALAEAEAKKAEIIKQEIALKKAQERQERREIRVAKIKSSIENTKKNMAEARKSREQQRADAQLEQAKQAKAEARKKAAAKAVATKKAKAQAKKKAEIDKQAEIARVAALGKAKRAEQAAKFSTEIDATDTKPKDTKR